MNEKLRRAIDAFINGQINDLGMDAPEAVSEALANVSRCLKRLEKTLPPERLHLLRSLENAISVQAGEEMHYYYKSGFYDAVHFLLERGK